VFDIRDDLREVKIGGSTVGQFLYDYQGLRIEKLGERGAERNTYDDQSILQQYQVAGCATIGDANCATGTTGQTRAKFDYGVSSLLSLNAQGEPTQFYLYDVLNSVANLTNSDGAVQARYQYDAWGIKRNQVGTSYNRFSFTGYEEDKETGLLYAKARYLDPDSGRFLSQDAWEGDNMIAPSSHKYLYAYQNPTVYVDLDGNEPITTIKLGTIAAKWAYENPGRIKNFSKGFARKASSAISNIPSTVRQLVNKEIEEAGQSYRPTPTTFDNGRGEGGIARQRTNQKIQDHQQQSIKTLKALASPITTAKHLADGNDELAGSSAFEAVATYGTAGRSTPLMQGLRKAKTSNGARSTSLIEEGVSTPTVKLANPLPESRSFARVMPKKYAEAFARGEGNIGGGEVWITAKSDLKDVTTRSQAQERLSLYNDFDARTPNKSGDTVVEFKLDNVNSNSVNTPIETGNVSPVGPVQPRGYGFEQGGRTAGGAREWVINNGTKTEIRASEIKLRELDDD
jgi:RHS repeat-associated protein